MPGMFDDLIPQQPSKRSLPAAQAAGGMFDDLVQQGTRDRDRKWSDVPGEAVSNIPSSGAALVGNIGHAVMHPIDTAQSLGRTAIGAAQKAGLVATDEHDFRSYADAVGKMVKDRYGSMQNFKRTLATDPIGAAADLSSVLTGGGGLVRGGAAGARAAGAAKAADVAGAVGEAASAAGRAVDPLSAAYKGASATRQALSPAAVRNARDVGELEKAGIDMTPGQRLGGIPKGLEDKASGLPILGEFIRSGRNQSIESFNKAVANQALAPIGLRLDRSTQAGHDAVAEVQQKLNTAYDRLLPHTQFNPDMRLAVRIRQIFNNQVRQLTPEKQQQFRGILQNYVRNRGTRWPMPGTEFKIIQSELSELARDYSRSPSGEEQRLGRALGSVHQAVTSAFERSNSPAVATQLRRINTGWAMYKRMEDAAVRRANAAGLFTPSDLNQAIRGQSPKGPFARGNAIMQRFSEAGQRVLPRGLPESGTPSGQLVRDALIGLGGLGGAHAVGMPLATTAKIAAGGIAAGLPYTRSGMVATNWAARNKRKAAAAANAAFQAGRQDEDVENRGLRFTVPGHGERDPLAP